jgi:hypothetical protein
MPEFEYRLLVHFSSFCFGKCVRGYHMVCVIGIPAHPLTFPGLCNLVVFGTPRRHPLLAHPFLRLHLYILVHGLFSIFHSFPAHYLRTLHFDMSRRSASLSHPLLSRILPYVVLTHSSITLSLHLYRRVGDSGDLSISRSCSLHIHQQHSLLVQYHCPPHRYS